MPRLSHDKIKAPLSVPLMVATYLVDSLNTGLRDEPTTRDELETMLVWPRAYNDNKQWFLSVAGVAPNASGEPFITGQTQQALNVDPDIAKYTYSRQLVVAQTGGTSLPGYGLDLVRMRVWSLTNTKNVPALEAEDMLERVKLVLNSIDGFNVWRMTKIPVRPTNPGAAFNANISNPNAINPDDLDATSNDYGITHYGDGSSIEGTAIPYNLAKFVGMCSSSDMDWVNRIVPDLYQVVPCDNDPRRRYDIELEHVVDWSSTVLDDNTIQQVSSGAGGGKETYTAFTVDFSIHVEFVGTDLATAGSGPAIGYRRPLVPQRPSISPVA